MPFKLASAIIFCWLLSTSCAPGGYTSVIYGDHYDPAKDHTTITMLPLGQINLPGKWTKHHYNSSSHQYFYTNADSVLFAVALNPWKRYEFYQSTLSEAELVDAFYKWESHYFQEQYQYAIQKIKEDTATNAIIWNCKNGSDVNGYFLFGSRRQVAYNLFVETPAWDEKKKIAFLEKMYTNEAGN